MLKTKRKLPFATLQSFYNFSKPRKNIFEKLLKLEQIDQISKKN